MQLPERAYHLAETANWPLIRRDGLLSAARLMRAAGEDHLLGTHRPRHTTLRNGVQVRDQGPMPPQALQRCLHDLTPAEWYAIINARVFFWFDPGRLNRQRAACKARAQVVLTLDARALVAAHQPGVAVTPINTGHARRKPARRGLATFVPLAEWLRSGWDSEAMALGTAARRSSHRPVELTILDAVPDVTRHLLRITHLAPSQPFAPTPD